MSQILRAFEIDGKTFPGAWRRYTQELPAEPSDGDYALLDPDPDDFLSANATECALSPEAQDDAIIFHWAALDGEGEEDYEDDEEPAKTGGGEGADSRLPEFVKALSLFEELVCEGGPGVYELVDKVEGFWPVTAVYAPASVARMAAEWGPLGLPGMTDLFEEYRFGDLSGEVMVAIAGEWRAAVINAAARQRGLWLMQS
ncbi:MAG: hypothetical protein PF961_07590 [Planctomycetota bacterium]|nr:hypothetical protein [Planctomycetota bacterium]